MITKRIKMYLKQRGISQEELGKMLGSSGQNMRNMLNKEHIHTSTIEKIATALNVDVSELLSIDEEGKNVSPTQNLICPNCGAKLKLVKDA